MKMLRIGTHSGTFHADEVLACAMLKILPKFQKSEIIRTRDPKELESCDIVVDVGGVYDPATNRFDHHQKTFSHSMSSLEAKYKYDTKLSSAGLVYFHFGKEIISTIQATDVKSSIVETLFVKVYEKFIQEVDAIDNGISTHDTEGRYTINTNFSRRIGGLNPNWNESSDDINERFDRAVKMADAEFRDKVNFFGNSWWPARTIVVKALENRFSVHNSGRVLEFTEGGVPWKEHLHNYEQEQELGRAGQLYYVIYTDQGGNWRVQCVPVNPDSFENRLSLPAAWCGLRDAELEKCCGVDGATFVHASGFTGGCKTKDGVMKMIELSLNMQKDS